MGIPVLQGRTFTESDSDRSQKVVVIDQFLARKYWPRGDAIGAQIRRGIDNDEPVCTIIGVVGSVKTSNLADHNPVGQVYRNYKQFVPQEHAPRGQNQSRRAVDRCHPPRDSARRRRTPAVRCEDHAGPCFCVGGEPSRSHDPMPDLRRTRAVAFCHRDLRRAGLHGDAAYARVRYPHGAGRERA